MSVRVCQISFWWKPGFIQFVKARERISGMTDMNVGEYSRILGVSSIILYYPNPLFWNCIIVLIFPSHIISDPTAIIPYLRYQNIFICPAKSRKFEISAQREQFFVNYLIASLRFIHSQRWEIKRNSVAKWATERDLMSCPYMSVCVSSRSEVVVKVIHGIKNKLREKWRHQEWHK